MTTLQTRSKDTIVAAFAAGVQGRLARFLNFALGSVWLALGEAVAGVALWLQAQNITVLKLTRLSTSYGDDADSWIADYGLIARLGAQASTGAVTFGRYTASGSAVVIPVGAVVQTGDGSVKFAVYPDPTNPAYSPTAADGGPGFVMAPQVGVINVPAQAVTAGTAGNVGAGAVSLIGSAVTGVDTVTNVAAFNNGIDQETDADLKARFRLALAGLSKGTDGAIRAAVAGVRVGLQVAVRNGFDLSGNLLPGYVTVIVDDGSGNLSSSLLGQCRTAVQGVVAAGVRYGVFAGVASYADVGMAVVEAPGFYKPTLAAQVTAAVSAFINSRGLGQGLAYFDLAAVAKGVPGVLKLEGLTLNGAAVDIEPNPRLTIKARNIAVV